MTAVISMLEVTKRNLKSYGQEVVEQRAVPDYRDGLKPVHRVILWSCYNLGLKYGTPFKKAARTVGDVIGKYHPHGDAAAYQAMVGLAGVRNDKGDAWSTKNSSVPLIEGYGNWGDNLDPAAASRYTEARLSEFSTKYLLDPIYLAVTDYVENFSGDDKVPLVLPARLPVLLFNGSVSIAFGVSAECPSFGVDGVLHLVKQRLQGKIITPMLCAKTLTFEPVFGGECVSERAEILAFHKQGYGSLTFVPFIEIDEKNKQVSIVSSCPGLSSQTSWSTLIDKLSQLREVKHVSDSTDRNGFRFEIVAERNVDFETFVDKIYSLTTRRYSYSIGVTYREKEGVTFKQTNAATIINDWCEWRVALELKVIKHLIGIEKGKLKRLSLLLLAVDNLKIIMESLSKEDSAAYLKQRLGITLEEANSILDLKVRQLKALERKKLQTQIATVKKELTTLNADLKNPTKRVLTDLNSVNFY
jgi:DNA gyrase subunit A